MTIKDIETFANQNKIPILFEDRTVQEYGLNVYFTCFEKDKISLRNFIYMCSPAAIRCKITTVPNQIKYTKKAMIEYRGNHEKRT